MLLDYCGAGSRLPVERGMRLDPDRWAWEPKHDGVYARVTLDRAGRISSILGRTGSPLSEARDLLGIVAGRPDSVVHGELDAHTEAGNRIAAARGWRALTLFDCTRCYGRDASRLPYSERYGLLHKMQAELEIDGSARRWDWLIDGQGDAHDSGGRYCEQIPHDLRRLPIVQLARGSGAAQSLWREHVELGGGEGLVAVNLDAPAGRRGAKRKIKASETLDCSVLSVGGGAAHLFYRGVTFMTSARGVLGSSLRPGDVVEVACDGWYEAGAAPRFARIIRRRTDVYSSPTPTAN